MLFFVKHPLILTFCNFYYFFFILMHLLFFRFKILRLPCRFLAVVELNLVSTKYRIHCIMYSNTTNRQKGHSEDISKITIGREFLFPKPYFFPSFQTKGWRI